MHDMMLRHVQHLMDVAPHEVLHKQVVDIELSMLLRNIIVLTNDDWTFELLLFLGLKRIRNTGLPCPCSISSVT